MPKLFLLQKYIREYLLDEIIFGERVLEEKVFCIRVLDERIFCCEHQSKDRTFSLVL